MLLEPSWIVAAFIGWVIYVSTKNLYNLYKQNCIEIAEKEVERIILEKVDPIYSYSFCNLYKHKNIGL